jgi:hypothetical protein
MVRMASARADVVVVVHHSGQEGNGAGHVPHGTEGGRGSSRRFTATAIGAGADVVFGSGPHVVRGVEQRNRRLAFYSTGNFAGWNNFARGGLSSQSGIATATLEHTGRTVRGRYIGVRLVGPGKPVPASGVVGRVRALSRADFGRRAARIARSGAISIR